MKMRTTGKRLLSMVLVLAMVFGMIPRAYAADDSQPASQATVTFHIEGGTWNGKDDGDQTVTVTLTDGKGTLDAASVPAGMQPHEGYVGGGWNETPVTEAGGITKDVTYTYSYVRELNDEGKGVPESSSYTVTAVGGRAGIAQEDGKGGYMVSRWADTLTVKPGQKIALENISVPEDAANSRVWMVKHQSTQNEYPAEKVHSGDTVLYLFDMPAENVTATLAGPARMLQEAAVTFLVVNGTWDGTFAEYRTVMVPLTEGKGTLAAAAVPTGMKPAEGYEGGAWDVTPNTNEDGITGNVTYTYSFTEKNAAAATVTVTFESLDAVNGPAPVTLTRGQTLDLGTLPVPAFTGSDNSHRHLIGWTVTPCNRSLRYETCPEYYKFTDSLTVQDDMTLYLLSGEDNNANGKADCLEGLRPTDMRVIFNGRQVKPDRASDGSLSYTVKIPAQIVSNEYRIQVDILDQHGKPMRGLSQNEWLEGVVQESSDLSLVNGENIHVSPGIDDGMRLAISFPNQDQVRAARGDFPARTIYVVADEGLARYRVVHRIEDWENAPGTYKVGWFEQLCGKPGTDTRAIPALYPGFTAQPVENVKIAADGSTVVDIYYNHGTESHSLNWDFGGGTPEGKYTQGQVVPGTPIVPPILTREGYIFDGWEPAVPEIMPNADVTYTARWITPVTVTVTGGEAAVMERIDGQYTVTGSWSSALSVAPGQLVACRVTHTPEGKALKQFEGTTVSGKEQSPGFVVQDGNYLIFFKAPEEDMTVEPVWAKAIPEISLRFEEPEAGKKPCQKAVIPQDANYIIGDTLSWTLETDKGTTAVKPEDILVPGRHYQMYAALEPAEGYAFGDSTRILVNGAPASDNLTIQPSPFNMYLTFDFTVPHSQGSTTQYKVLHMLEKLGDAGNFEQKDVQTLSGKAGAYTAAAAKTYEGFTAQPVTQQIIAADGSTVVEIRYTPNVHTLAWDLQGGTVSSEPYTQGQVPFGTAVTAPVLTREGFVFGGWRPALEETMPDRDVTYEAKWLADGATVTFRVVNGTWDGEDSEDIKVHVPMSDGMGTLEYKSVPNNIVPLEGYRRGTWDVTPNTCRGGITEDVTYTFSCEKITSTSKATVTFKVVNGTWADDTTEDKTVKIVLTNGRGTLPGADVPKGMKPNDGYEERYEESFWDLSPALAVDAITGDLTYTYTFGKKQIPITEVAIAGLTLPEYNAHPDFDLTVPEGAPYHFATYEEIRKADLFYIPPSAKASNGCWWEAGFREYLTPEDRFRIFEPYRLSVLLVSNEGYEFVEDTTFTINGGEVKSDASLGPKCIMVETHGLNITPPAQSTASVTFRVVNGTWEDGTNEDKTVEVPLANGRGTLDQALIPTGMKPAEGSYAEGEWFDVDTGEGRIKGDTICTYLFEEKRTLITEVAITDFSEPVYGAYPDYDLSIPENAPYHFATRDELEACLGFMPSFTVNGVYWRGPRGYYVDPKSTFLKETTDGYIMEGRLVANEGYEFADSVEFTLNGYPMGFGGDVHTDENKIALEFHTPHYQVRNPDSLPKLPVTDVIITGFTRPTYGKPADYDLNIEKGSNCHFSSSAELEAAGRDPESGDSGMSWVHASNPPLKKGEVFTDTSAYAYSFMAVLIPNEGYEFTEDTRVSLNTSERVLRKSYGSCMEITVIPRDARGYTVDPVISEIHMSGFRVPASGEAPGGRPKLPDNFACSFADEAAIKAAGYDYSEEMKLGYWWRDDNGIRSSTEAFRTGETCWAEMILSKEEGFRFEENVTAILNLDPTLTRSVTVSGDTVHIVTREFTVEDLVTEVSLTGLTAPVYGEKPVFALSIPEGAPYRPATAEEISSAGWQDLSGQAVSGMVWKNKADIMSPEECFGEDGIYHAALFLAPAEGRKFADEVTVTINEKQVAVKNVESLGGILRIDTADFTVKKPDQTMAAYTVRHMLEKLGTAGNFELEEAQTLSGRQGADTAAVAKTYEGFTAKPVTQQTIAADGSTVVEIRYTRNVHALTWDLQGGTAASETYTRGQVPFGTAITAPTLTREGYAFKGWKPEAPKTMPDADVTCVAQWTAQDPTSAEAKYTVLHLQEMLATAGTYEILQAEELRGAVGAETAAAARQLPGFTAQPFKQVKIAADGSAQVEIKYNRNRHALTWDFQGGDAKGSYTQGQVPFGAMITAPVPTREGYHFDGWNTLLAQTMPDADLTYTASWTTAEHVHKLSEAPGQAPTRGEDGWKSYYECTCGRYFEDADGKKEIPSLQQWKQGDGKLPKLGYKFLDGMNASWQKDSGKDLTFRADGDLEDFVNVQVDGKAVDPRYYTVSSGSTVLTLKADYLQTLKTGTHTLTAQYRDGQCDTDFRIKSAPTQPGKGDPTSPKTGDESHLLTWSLLSMVSLAAATVVLFPRKKREK